MSALFVVGAFCTLLLAIRLVGFPQIEAHRAQIAQWLGSRIGQPVEIDSLVAGWDGWNPRLAVRGVRIRDPASGGTLLELPSVDLIVAWTSLPLLDFRLKELSIESPRLAVRRDAAGRLHIGGIEMASDSSVDDPAFADWLIRQPRIVIRDALVVWDDELRRAPQLLLDHVQFRLEQRFGRHRLGLTGVPPPELASPIDLRADVTGRSLKDLSALRGKLYLRLDYADVAAWREWLPLPIELERGEGALRVWVDFAQSQTLDVVADLELADVRAKLATSLPPLALAHVSGRASWKRTGARTQITATQLAFELPDGTGVAPTDFALTFVTPAGSAPGGGNLTVKEVDLPPLAAIAAQLPLPEALRREIARHEPRGTLRNAAVEWSGDADAPAHYSVKTEFRNFGIAVQDALPGVANVSGSLDATERGGTLHLASQGATVAAPTVIAEPLTFASLKGDVAWQRGTDATQLQLSGVAFANADVTGTASGSWRSHAEGPGEIDLKLQLTHFNLADANRYLPASASPGLRDWVRRALVKGMSSDARMTLVGDLARFPFAQGGGQFLIVGKAQDATLQYASDWPPITGISGEVRIEGARLAVSATSARTGNAQIGATRAEIPELGDAHPVLRVDGVVTGPTSEFLAFITQTPVAGWIGHVTDGATATGDGRLALKLELPLRDVAQTTVAGEYEFMGDELRLAGTPQLRDLNGKLLFTRRDAVATDLTAQAFGGPAKLRVVSEDGHLRIAASGNADVRLVMKEYDAPLAERVSGTADWQLSLEAHDQQVSWSVASPLSGAGLDLPAPIGKPASETVPLRIERREVKPREDRIVIDYGRIARILLRRQADAPANNRALVLVGKAIGDTADPEQPGVWIRADVGSLNLDDWLAVAPANGAPPKDPGVQTSAINGIDLRAASLQAFGRTFTNLKTTARRQDADWRLTLDGDEVAGTATWRAANEALPNGRLVARLARLATPAAVDSAASGASAATTSGAASRWPAIDIVADALLKKGHELGKLELLAQPSSGDWQIRKLVLANEAGRIDAQGSFRSDSGAPSTQLDVVVDVKDAAKFLESYGWPDAVKGAPTRIEGKVSSTGAPSEFDYPSLAGSFKLHAGAGQFTKLDPGVGRLLGVLSLQALPRRISLDFRDVFSEGFAFDSVSADVQMQNGVMHTDNFRLAGPAAAVTIAGDVDLARETQQLKVRVQPSLSSGVSAGAAALFIANPLIGAAVGAGALLAQKILNNPIDQLFSYQYAVSGSWDDPVVTRVGAQPAAAAQSSATIR